MKVTYRNTDIKFNPLVYEPSEDSFLLVEAVFSEIRTQESVLEVGCGSGIISSVIKSNTDAKITGIDINPHAVKCSRENGIEVIRGDLLSCIRGRFDMIIFNPPYLPTREDERTADWLNTALDGGYNGRRIIDRFLEDCPERLTEYGRVLILVSSLTGIEDVRSKMIALGFKVKEVNREKFMFEELVVLKASRICT